MAPLSVCYSHTYWLACCLVKRPLAADFVQIQAYLGSERLDFWKEKKKKKQ